MTDVKKQVNRIPQESLTEPGSVSAWKLPSIGEPKKVVKSAKREKKATENNKNNETIEDVPRHAKPKPPTAEQLQQMAEQAQQEGYADGFKEGMEKGLAQGEEAGLKSGETKAYQETKKKLDDEIKRLGDIADQLMDPLKNQDQQLETLIMKMVVQLTEKLLSDEISAEPKKIGQIVTKAINALPVGAKNITVYVNEADAKLLDELIPASHRNWQLNDDNTLVSGGCRIETADSLIDFSVEKRLADYFQQVEETSPIESGDNTTDTHDSANPNAPTSPTDPKTE